MDYRPQFAFPTPDGFEDQDFDHYYDSANTLGLNIPPGNVPVRSIPLNIDPDAPFLWRGIKWPMGTGLRDVRIRLYTPEGDPLQDDLVRPGGASASQLMPAWLFAVPPASGPLNGGQSCIIESEIECRAGSAVLLDVQYSSPQQALGSGPNLIAAGGSGLGSYSGVRWGAVSWKGNLWQFVGTAGAPPSSLGAFKSVDGGASWQQIDAPDAPGTDGGSCFFWDGVSNIVTVMYNPNATAGAAPIALRNFDLDAEAWGSDFATGNAPTMQPQALWRRSNGSYIALFVDQSTPTTPANISIFGGATWSAPLDITTGATALPGWGAAGATFRTTPTSILDSSDRLHVLFETLQHSPGTPNWNARYFYQQITAGGGLGSFLDFPGQNVATINQDLAQAGNGVASRLEIVGDSVVWGVIRQVPGGGAPQAFPAVYVGSPLAAPVWVESGSLNSNSSSALRPESSFPNVFFDAVNNQLYAVWVRGNLDASAASVVFGFTRAAGFLTGWQTQTIFDIEASAVGSGILFYPLPVFGVNGVVLGMSLDITIGGDEQRYWIGYPGLALILTGVKRYPKAAGVIGQQEAGASVTAAAAASPSTRPLPGAPVSSAGCPPVYSNLCWALRNGMVDAAQFDPQELAQLQYVCAQLGYTGSCAPPACVSLYLAANRGRLPHIPVPASALVAIQPAPAIGDCVDSWRKGGVPEGYISGPAGLGLFMMGASARGRRR